MLFGEGPQIKNIAADLNKLFRQGSLLNQSGQTVEGDSTADQATVDLLARKDPVIQEISVGMSGEQSARYTVSGTPPLSLPNSLGKPLKAWSVDLLPYQEGTGDPAPDNVRPIHGTDKLTVTTALAGSNIYSDRFADYTKPVNYYICPITLPNGYIRLNAELIGEPMTGVAVGIAESGTSYPGFVGQRLVLGTNGQIIPYNSNVVNWESPCLCIYVSGEAQFNQIFENYHIWLTVGNDQTSYTPYVAPSQTVLTLPQTVYTGTIGSDGGESRWGVQLLNGGMAFAGSGNQIYRSLTTLVHTFDYTQKIICDKLPVFTRHDANAFKNADYGITGFADVGNRYPNNNWIYIKIAGCTTPAEVSAWLTDNNVTIVYEATDSTPIAITAPTIPTPTGTATTWATAEDGMVDGMEVTYVGKA